MLLVYKMVELAEHNAVPPFLTLIDAIHSDVQSSWGIACIKRDYLRPMTNEAFLLTIQSALQEVDRAEIFFINGKRIYIAWAGSQKKIYKNLRTFIGSVLSLPGSDLDYSTFVSYVDPRAHAEELKTSLKDEMKKMGIGSFACRAPSSNDDPFDFDGDDDEDSDNEPTNSSRLVLTDVQRARFAETKNQLPYRKQLHILVAEDQVFSQKLLCEIIRGVRSGGQDAPMIDVVSGIQEAWKIYLKKAHDIVFADLGLTDGSGHALARAIKELDPVSQVIIVTANNFEEELGVARQNNVDGFIAKPYNKKQILDCIDKYIASQRGRLKGGARGTASQF